MSLQSCPTLCDPIDGSLPGSPVPGILQARTSATELKTEFPSPSCPTPLLQKKSVIKRKGPICHRPWGMKGQNIIDEAVTLLAPIQKSRTHL